MISATNTSGSGRLSRSAPLFSFKLSRLLRRDGEFTVIGRPAKLVGHFQEEEASELFEVVAITDAVIAQRNLERPDIADDGGGVVGFRGHGARLYSIIFFERDSLF